MNICHTALKYRIARTKQAKSENAPLLYMYGAFGKRLMRTDSVDEVFKNSRATISLGYIGFMKSAPLFMVQIGNTIRKAMILQFRLLRRCMNFVLSGKAKKVTTTVFTQLLLNH